MARTILANKTLTNLRKSYQDNLVLLASEGNLLAHVVGLASDLDPFVEVSLEVAAVHDAVLNGVSAVDGELEGGLLASDLSEGFALQGLLAGLVCLLSGHISLLGDLLVSRGLLGGCLNWGLDARHDGFRLPLLSGS